MENYLSKVECDRMLIEYTIMWQKGIIILNGFVRVNKMRCTKMKIEMMVTNKE